MALGMMERSEESPKPPLGGFFASQPKRIRGATNIESGAPPARSVSDS